MGKEVRSIRYFDGLFMKAEEFIQEQNYHTRMRRLHNRYLHSSGIVWGLEIQKSKKPGANPADVTVTQGMALNKIEEDGEEVSKEIILTDDTDVSLLSYGAGKTVYIYISYSREAAPKDSEDSKNIHWLEEGKPVSGTDRSQINEDEKVLLGKVSLINANGTVTVDKIDYEDSSGSLRKYAGFSGKSLQAEKIILAINGVTSGFASIEGKQTGTNNGIQVNSPITSFAGALSIGDKLGVGGNVQLPDNKSLVLGNTNPVSLHNNSAAPELWLEATGQASSALVIGTAFDADKQVKIKYAPGAVGAAAGELRIGQDVKIAGAFTHGITTLYTNGAERLRIDATGNVIIGTGNLKIPGLDTFLDFGADTRQMINLWGNGPNAAYGIGVQGWTQYYRSSGNFAWYIGGTHSDAELDPGSGGSAAMIIKRGSGNVGIGTANPPQKLSIKGLESSAHGMGAAIGISNAAPGGANWYLRAGATGTSTPESGFSIADDIGYRLVIDKSGNVGIGTNSPGDKLDVEGSIRVNDSNIWLRGGADINHAIGYYGGTKLFATANIDGPAVYGWSGGALGTTAGGQKIALYWNSAANVGIGQTSPLYRLHVTNSGGFGGENADGTSQAGNVPLVLQSDSTVFGILNSNSRQAFALNIEGNGGTTSARGYPVFYDKYDGNWRSSIYLRNGTVGIGTSTPQVKFHVVGNRIRLQKGNGHNLDLRADGSAFDIESLDEDLYINNISNTAVRIKNFVNISSREMKENFSELSGTEAFETLENLNPLRFQYKGDTRGELHLGFIAEDVSRNVATEDRKGINPMAIVAVLTRVVKEQQKMILTLQESIGFAK
ncbi:Chaperone of endosialidase [uncultured archaeon]|nr:Chaperone of endosialidase [uncultured archaeon]